MAMITGGQLIARMLRAEEVEVLFGIPDGTYLHLFVNAVEQGMRLVTPRHETTAAHMAGAYARMTGKLGVCIASNGPGVANLLPGVAVENAEGNRVLLITSSRRTGITYPDRGGAYQYFDQVGAIRPMAKWSAAIPSVERIPELLRKAFRACYQGRPGVVHLDIPENFMNGEIEDRFPVLSPHQYRRTIPFSPDAHLVERAAELLTRAEFPVIHAGSGVIHAGAYEELEAVANLLTCPVTTSWSARGVLREDSPLAWPMVWMPQCIELHTMADTVLCLGAGLGETDWWGKAPYWRRVAEQPMIQVDVDETVLGRNRPAEIPVLSDARAFLSALLPELEKRQESMPLAARKERLAGLTASRDQARKDAFNVLSDMSSPMVTAHVSAACREVFDDAAVAVFDGGNAAVWANTFHEIRVPNTQLGTWHFGHLGAGPGQALGAAVARPESQVYCVIGDGAFGFHPQEIETAVRHDLKVVFLVCCDKQWGMVKLTQMVGLGQIKDQFPKALQEGALHINGDLGEIAWDALGRAMGAHGERVADPQELKPAIERCLNANRCSVIHVDVDPGKHLMPPGILYFKEMHQEPAGE